jgi:hypothetical protein
MNSPNTSNSILRGILVLAGTAIVALGANVGFGGIQTLGWQGGGDFLAVTDATEFGIHDSHVRFIGGVWLAVGLIMLAGAVAFRPMRPVLTALMAMIFVGGLVRLSAWDAAILTNLSIAPSLFLELVFFPLLGLWIARTEAAPMTSATRT